MDIDLKQKFKSHPDKLLFDHLMGVAEKACMRWDSKFAEVLSFFHDLGKINPNFQNKLQGQKTGYDNHSYLSALVWILFFNKNSSLIKEWIGDSREDVFAIATIIAKHHGNLTDNVIIVCSIENVDPMGVHTGDSITVAHKIVFFVTLTARARSDSSPEASE